MMHYIFCISGFSGAGKDECAGHLTKYYGALQTGLADAGKRHMADTYGFTEQQLFGPSHFRNEGDIRIEKNEFRDYGLKKWENPLPKEIQPGTDVGIDPSKSYWTYKTGNLEFRRPFLDMNEHRHIFVHEGDPEFWLSPREALQQYLEKMNMLDVYTWIRKGVADHLLLATGKYGYSRMHGLISADEEDHEDAVFLGRSETLTTCFADFRHVHEIQYIRDFSEKSQFTPILIRVKRPSIKKPPYNHRSETEQTKIRDAAFDFIVDNDRDLTYLYQKMDEIVLQVKSRKIVTKPWRKEYVVQSHNPEEGYIP